GCPPLSILSPTPLTSQMRTSTPLSGTTRRLTTSLRPNSPSHSPNGTLGANSSNTAGGLSTPSGSAGSNKPGPRARAVTTRAPAPHLPVNHAYRTPHLRSDRRTPQRLHRSRPRHRQAPSRAALAQQ